MIDKKKTTSSPTGERPENPRTVSANQEPALGLPSTGDIKARFGEKKIPLDKDFEALIDIADIGRKAVLGSATGPTGSAGDGLEKQEGNGQLMVKTVKPLSGIHVGPDGVAVSVGAGLEINKENEVVATSVYFEGMIIMYSGNLAAIPEGWYLCDGGNDTPDLSNRFILGATALTVGDQSVDKAEGGLARLNTDRVGHEHGVSGEVGGHPLTVAQMPGHYHEGGEIYSVKRELGKNIAYSHYDQRGTVLRNASYTTCNETLGPEITSGGTIYHSYTSSVGQGESHGHGRGSLAVTGGGEHSHSGTCAIPYYALAFIMYTGKAKQ